MSPRAAAWIAALLSLGAAARAEPAPPSPEALRRFESGVRPLLLQRCVSCHGPRLQQGGLRLDSRAAILRGGRRGPAVDPGRPEASLLLRVLRHRDPELKMPPGARLPDHEIARVAAWVREGAPWPDAPARRGGGEAWWALRPVRRPAAPPVRDRAWPAGPIDAFLLSALEARGLRPAPPADRRALLRRATFDLTGLPPTPAEIEAFLSDRRPDAWERVVERLLASPRYGERWGRHWLDAVRYADSNGLDENYHYAHAFRYRDYVIDAFNRDLPYDRFLTEQLAGDLLPGDDPEERYRRLTATGFFLLGPKLLANPDKTQVLADIVDEQIDVTSRVFMGVTLACARCHDHKFDPFSQRDYTALAGILRSTRSMVSLKDRLWSERPLAPPEAVERADAHAREAEALRQRLQAARRAGSREAALAGRLEAELKELERRAPPPLPYALAVADGDPEDAPFYVRGDHNRPEGTVPRGFPAVLSRGASPRLDGPGSGRLELARWLTRPDHPLTARVLVNRVWQGHFGRGLAATADNFGALGEPPSHPELLDYLAAEFVENGWSIKALHREIMRSRAYRMSAAFDARAHRQDPENRLLWRVTRRRLSAEEQRDAMLFAAGRLDLTMGGTLLAALPNREQVTNDGSNDLAAGVYDSPRRTVYLPVIRNSLFEMLELFDFGDPSAVTARRSETISPTQALFLLNNPLMLAAAGDLADLLLARPGTDAERVGEAYLRIFGRPPAGSETERALAFVAGGAETARRDAWQRYCQALFCASEFLYVE